MDESEKYEKQLQFEHELINRRLTWLLSSQSIMFAASAFVLGNADHQKAFFKIVSFLGITISLLIWIGITMGIIAKYTTYKDFKGENKRFGVRNWITWIALIPDFFMPIAFAFAWLYIFNKMGG